MTLVFVLPSFVRNAKLMQPGRIAAVAVLSVLSACGPAPAPSGIDDPNEANNRQVHAFNRSIDHALRRPTANTYSSLLPEPIEDGVSNFAQNLDAPGDVVNNVLQLRLGKAVENTLRFAINSTLGVGGPVRSGDGAGRCGRPDRFRRDAACLGRARGRICRSAVHRADDGARHFGSGGGMWL